ncbi:S-layer homology domain-containing protein [Oscillospiraceae bacterium MB08-C2-2]|nr:S-layer homology domain-containing protein [Oscillospiraceae bacterium MB08-C2-2]
MATKRILSIWLSVCMVLTLLPVSAMAEEGTTPLGTSGEIIAFASLTETERSVPLGTSMKDLELPETLTATVRTAVAVDSSTVEKPLQDSRNPDNLTEAALSSATPAGSSEPATAGGTTELEWNITTSDIPVTWISAPKYDMDAEGVYIFTPVTEGYTVSAALPEITVAVGTQPLMRALRTGTPATYGDFSVSIDEDGAAPTYENGVLTFGAAGEYTVGMADEKASTSHVIVVNATGEVKLNLNGVVIEAPPSGSYRVPDGATALTVTSGTITLNMIADSSLTGGIGYSSLMDSGKGGAGISGNVTVMGTAALTATGGKGGSVTGGTSGTGGAGISGNVTVTEDAALTATGGKGGSAEEGTGGVGGSGISGNVTVTGAATLTATGGAAGTGGAFNGIAGVGINGDVNVSDSATLIASSGSGMFGMAISNAGRNGGGTITVDEGYIVKVGDNAAAAANCPPLPHDQLTNLASLYIIVTPPSDALPTAAAYAAASPAAASGTDYVLDDTNRVITIKTTKGAAWWSANGANYLDYTVLLDDNIDVSGFQWSPVGSAPGSAFAGSFDGQGHTITGLTVKIEAGDETVFAGLLGEFCGSVKNVGLINVSIAVSNTSTNNKLVYAGALAGDVFGGTISNCFVRGGSVSAASGIGSYAGGLIGYGGQEIAIANCYSTADVSADGMQGCNGGVIGMLSSGTVDQCYYVNMPAASGTNLGLGTKLTDAQMKAVSGTENALIDRMNTWVEQQDNIDYYTWQVDSGTTNDGYPVFGAAWTEPQAQWGVAGTEDAAPATWAGSGSLTDAVAYANGFASGTAYIQLLEHVNISATLEFAEDKTTVLDLKGKTIDGNDIPTSSLDYNVLTVNGNLTLCDTSSATVANQGKITGGHGAGEGAGGGIYVDGSGVFIMAGGNITGNTAVTGGGVANRGTFTMSGGSIAGNSCISGSGDVSIGGGVANLGGFTMSGGSITGNTVVAGGAGGGVLTSEGMMLSGNANISGNTVGEASDNVALMPYSGHPSNIYITGALTNSTAIGVSIVELSRDHVLIPKAGVFTTGEAVTNSDYISKFVSDNSGFAVIADGSQLKLAAAQIITKTAATNGSFTVKVNGNKVPSAREGQTVTVTPTADANYELDTITVTKTGDPNTTLTVTSGAFTMPAYAVTVSVTFKAATAPGYTISGTVKGSDTSAGIPAALQLKNSSGNVGGVVTAATDGRYIITGVSAGSYTIAVSYTGYDSGAITGVTVTNTNITNKNLTLTKTISGLTDAQKLAAAQAAIMAAINRMSVSNSTTAADILSVAQAASLYGVTVAWDTGNGFTKTQATSSAKGFIRGTLKLTLNQESGGIGIDAAIAKLSTGNDNGGRDSDSGSDRPTLSTKPTEPVTGSTENKATVDNTGNASVSLTDKNITDAIANAQAEAAKKGVSPGDITAVIHVTTAGKDADTVTVNLPKTTQEKVIGNKIFSVQLVIDRPDLTIGIDLAAVTEINRQAKADVQLSATRMDNTKLPGDAKAAIGSRPAYDLKALYGNGKSVTDFGKGSVSVEIPYTLQKNEAAGYVYAVYVDAKGKVTYLTDSSYDAKRGTVVFSTSHFSTYGVAYKAGFNFTDIGGHWAKDDILFAANRGLITGTSTTTFSPGGSMTRGMFVTALGRLANADIRAYKQSSFTDVKADAYYMGYIEWASKNNILVGTEGGKFDPDGLVTREQMAVIMRNYAKAMGYTVPKVHVENIFSDNAKISTHAKEAVKQMQMAGVISGKNSNLFDPQGTATRAEVSAVLRRFVELMIFSDTMQGWTMNHSGQWMFYQNGRPAIRWKDIETSGNSKRYYFDSYGVMIAGKWLQVDGKWYYFYADGSLAKNTKIDGYQVDENGIRKTK